MSGSLNLSIKTKSLAENFHNATQALDKDKNLAISSKLNVRAPRNKIIEWILSFFGVDSTSSYKKTARELNELIASRSVQVPFGGAARDQFNADVEKILDRVLHVTKNDGDKLEIDPKFTKNKKTIAAIEKIYSDTLANIKKIEFSDEVIDLQKKYAGIAEEIKRLEMTSKFKTYQAAKKEELKNLEGQETQDSQAIEKAKKELSSAEENLKKLQKEVEANTSKLRNDLAAKKEELKNLEGQETQDSKAIEKVKNELSEIAQKLTRLESEQDLNKLEDEQGQSSIGDIERAIAYRKTRAEKAFKELIGHQGKPASNSKEKA